MSSNDCIFCKIVDGQIPSIKVYEDDAVVAFLDIGPLSDGHTLVIPKAHYDRFDQCPPEVAAAIAAVATKVAKAVASSMNCDGYNVLCNNGLAAGQLVDHVHFHIIPRNDGDGVFNSWPAHSYEQGRAEAIAAKILEKM